MSTISSTAPKELLNDVFQNLNYDSIKNTRLASRYWDRVIRDYANSLPRKEIVTGIRFVAGNLFFGNDNQPIKMTISQALKTFWRPSRVCLNWVNIEFKKGTTYANMEKTFKVIEALFRRTNVELGGQNPMSVKILEVNYYHYYWRANTQYVISKILSPLRIECATDSYSIFNEPYIFQNHKITKINITHHANYSHEEIRGKRAVNLIKFLTSGKFSKNKIYVTIGGEIDIRFLYSLLGELEARLKLIEEEYQDTYIERYLWKSLDIHVKYRMNSALARESAQSSESRHIRLKNLWRVCSSVLRELGYFIFLVRLTNTFNLEIKIHVSPYVTRYYNKYVINIVRNNPRRGSGNFNDFLDQIIKIPGVIADHPYPPLQEWLSLLPRSDYVNQYVGQRVARNWNLAYGNEEFNELPHQQMVRFINDLFIQGDL